MAGDARAVARRRILVVDDDPEIRSLTRLVLEGEGYLVRAGDGESAVNRALAGARPGPPRVNALDEWLAAARAQGRPRPGWPSW
jgi:CheY-like chemotaxis protein